MNFVVFALVITVLVFSTAAAEDKIHGRIFNGQDATWDMAKYTVVIFPLRSRYFGLKKKVSLCGGTIIAPNWVLTVAHCVTRIKEIRIYFGIIESSECESSYKVQKDSIFRHPNYDRKNEVNDVALIQVPKTRQCDSVGYARMPFKWIDRPLTNMTVIAAGWGQMGNAGPMAQHLQSTRMELISNEECSSHFDQAGHDVLCAATSKPYGSICYGDSGGPVVLEESGEVVGVAAIIVDQCEAGKPAILMRVASFLPWISEVTGITS